jgi:DME family drug/metabolite transporter
MAGYVLCWFLGIERRGVAVPTLIALCLPPVIVTFVAIVRGRERLDRSLVVALAAALTGTGLVVLRHDGPAAAVPVTDLSVGVAFSVGSAVLYAGFTMVSGRLSEALGAGPATTCLTLVAVTAMAPFALLRPLQWPGTLPPQAWYLYLGVVTAALALLAFTWGAARLSPTALTVATLMEPLTAVAVSAFVMGVAIGGAQAAGGLLLMSSLLALGRRTTTRADRDVEARITTPSRD